MKKTAIFPGSFNPFHIGHAELVRLGLDIFDKIIILFCINSSKKECDVEKNMNAVVNYYSELIEEGRIEVIKSEGLTADVAKEYNAVILRGLRNSIDFEYERNIAGINRTLGAETVFLIADMKYDIVSSSNIRELMRYDVDVSEYIPKKEKRD